MFFEGAEKKAEIFVDCQYLNLLERFNDDFWYQLTAKCGAKIISSQSDLKCKAFILSESSLFVWADRMLIITCGETDLIAGIEFLFEHIGTAHVIDLFYQRKNEYWSDAQPSDFLTDAKQLDLWLSGKAYCFGDSLDHHNYVFHLQPGVRSSAPRQSFSTYELLCYQLDSEVSQWLTSADLPKHQVRQFLALDEVFADFELNDHMFSPFGYSLNAIKEDQYLTIHITPQQQGSYVSFESNVDFSCWIPHLLACLKPASFDFMGFNASETLQKRKDWQPQAFATRVLVSQRLQNEVQVDFVSCFADREQPIAAIELF